MKRLCTVYNISYSNKKSMCNCKLQIIVNININIKCKFKYNMGHSCSDMILTGNCNSVVHTCHHGDIHIKKLAKCSQKLFQSLQT